MRRVLLLGLVLLTATGCVTRWTVHEPRVYDAWLLALPADARILPPEAAVPAPVRLYSGRWVGVVNGLLLGLVVEEVTAESLVTVLSAHGQGVSGYERRRLTVRTAGDGFTFRRPSPRFWMTVERLEGDTLAFQSQGERPELYEGLLRRVP